jgi:hypothetical protein
MLAFGDLAQTIWGAGWISDSDDGERRTLLLVGDGSGRMIAGSLGVTAGQDGDEWQLGDDRNALTASPVGEPVPVHDAENRIEGYDQLCRVTGRLDGGERTVECHGVRTWFSGAVDLEGFESIRAVSSWFEPGEALAVTAFRARKAKAHDSDVMTAAVIAPEGSAAVEEPRLSTTYELDGWPVRAGLELWLPVEGSDEQQYPRRASGEATGARAEGCAGGLDIRAEPFRWHSRGRDGAGMYILARRR